MPRTRCRHSRSVPLNQRLRATLAITNGSEVSMSPFWTAR